jgi:hypothetical protein
LLLETNMFLDGGWNRALPSALDSARTLILAFGAAGFGERGTVPFRELREAFPKACIIGCSTAGEIHGGRIYDGSVVIAIARFEATAVRAVSVPIAAGTASFDAGADLARSLAGPGLRAIIVLSEGLEVNGSALVRGINSSTRQPAVVTGGLAADGDRFKRTWVFDGEAPQSGRAVAVGLYGERVLVTHGSKGGWDMFGVERRVTRSEGNVLFELDGKPALRLYRDYLGERASGLPATALLFPLAVREHGADDKRLVRTVLAVDERSQSLVFAGDIPCGALVQLMRANSDRLIQGASDAATAAGEAIDRDATVLSVGISCVGRRLVLGERTEEEIEATLEALPARTHQIGYYSYGEISPFSHGTCDLHNQTMTLTTVTEQ